MERLDYDLLFRWFVGLGVDDPAFDHSSFSTAFPHFGWDLRDTGLSS